MTENSHTSRRSRSVAPRRRDRRRDRDALFAAIVIFGSMQVGIDWGVEGRRPDFSRSISG